MSNMILNVEFVAGTDLKYALKEAKEKAESFDVALICFDFNGISFSISSESDIEEEMELYRDNCFRRNEK